MMKLILTILIYAAMSVSLWSQSSSREVLSIDSDWEQVITTTNPGSRSEGQQSALLFRGTIIEARFEKVILGTERFVFVQGNLPWDFVGYERIDAVPVYSPIPSAISPGEIIRGWYKGRPEERKIDTPADWIWAGHGDILLFLDPQRISEVADHYNLRIISSDSGNGLVPVRQN